MDSLKYGFKMGVKPAANNNGCLCETQFVILSTSLNQQMATHNMVVIFIDIITLSIMLRA